MNQKLELCVLSWMPGETRALLANSQRDQSQFLRTAPPFEAPMYDFFWTDHTKSHQGKMVIKHVQNDTHLCATSLYPRLFATGNPYDHMFILLVGFD
jgi:hypothetical protein